MTAKRKSLATAMACASAIVVLAGCSQDGDIKAKGASGDRNDPVAATSGGSLEGLNAGQIADRAVEATKAAGSLTMAGRIEKDGEPFSVDLALDSAQNCTGRLGVKGGRAELRQVAETMYLKGDRQFWSASLQERSSASPDGSGNDAVVELMTGRWIKMPAGSIKDMDRLCDLKAMFARMDVDEADRKRMTKGPDAKVDGVPTVTLVKRQQGTTTTVHVAKEGKPHVLKIVRAGGDETGTIVLSGYGKPVQVEAPPADEVVDLDSLTGRDGLGFEAGETHTGEQSGDRSGTDGESGTGPDIGLGAGTDGGTGSGTDSETDSETDSGNDAGYGTGADVDPDTGSDSGTGADAESGGDVESGGDTEPGDTGTDTGSGAGTSADSETAS
ncbi:MSCRAMM family adhesin SdrC [Streptomyces peucetius]|uniref:MSCRAMM family adhesin SdrC n=1 Tax=Streptomyces peucetius TaxID=1950 RepID=A0ABY6IB96_STRPE|nr:MSCRAMM family adhesin SdrC [Streptomyces peucetius]UYQ64265.1 MSCRAMM family adhesin SdrC [Streptomyces peucetius]